MNRTAMVIIDMLRGLVYGYPPFEERFTRIIEPIRRLAEAAQRKGIPIIHASVQFRRAGDGWDDGGIFEMLDHQNESFGLPVPFVRESLQVGTEAVEVIPQLKGYVDYVVSKNRYSAFYGGDFETLLKALRAETLIITGIVTNVCVRATALDAFQKGWKTVVPRECVETYSDRAQEQGLEDLDFTSGRVLPLDEVLRIIG